MFARIGNECERTLPVYVKCSRRAHARARSLRRVTFLCSSLSFLRFAACGGVRCCAAWCGDVRQFAVVCDIWRAIRSAACVLLLIIAGPNFARCRS